MNRSEAGKLGAIKSAEIIKQKYVSNALHQLLTQRNQQINFVLVPAMPNLIIAQEKL